MSFEEMKSIHVSTDTTDECGLTRFLCKTLSKMKSSHCYLLAIPIVMLFVAYGNTYRKSLERWDKSPQLILDDIIKDHTSNQTNKKTGRSAKKKLDCSGVAYFKAQSLRNSLMTNSHSQEDYQTHLTETMAINNTLTPYLNLSITKNFNSTYLNPCWFEYTEGRNRQLKCLPYFFLAGFPKCGTTDLYFKMALHPQIVRGLRKEPHWWSRKRLPVIDAITGKNKYGKPFSKYKSNYDGAAHCMEQIGNLGLPDKVRLVTGDGSASTIWDNSMWRSFPGNSGLDEPRVIMADHIRHYLPASKIIAIVREPTSRLWSDYLYFWRDKSSPPSAEDFHNKASGAIQIFTDCIKVMPLRACAYDRDSDMKVRLYIGLYSIYLKDWYKIFPRRQIHVLRTEDYATSRSAELMKIFEFLGLDQIQGISSSMNDLPKKNIQRPRYSNRTMWEKTKRILQEFYAPFNTDLAKLLNNKDYLWAGDVS